MSDVSPRAVLRKVAAAITNDELPAVRLNPPDSTEWFVELLAVPEPGQQQSSSLG
jgi:hypothetical protein